MSCNSTDFVLTGDINSPTYAVALGIEAVIGITVNVAVLLMTLYQRKSWNQPSTVFFTSLLMSNLIMALFFLMSSIAVGAEEWILGNTFEEKNATCLISAYMLWNSGMTISATLSVISIDRFLFIVKPHLHKRFMRPRVALILIIGLWLLCSLIHTTPFYGFGVFGYYSPGGICSLMFECSGLYLLVLLVIYPMIYGIIAFTSIWTFLFTRSFIKRQGRSVDSGVYQSKNKKLFGIFGSMLLSYIIAILPSYVVSILGLMFGQLDSVFAFSLSTYGLFMTISPLIQSYFRPEIKETLVFFAKKIGFKSSRIHPIEMEVSVTDD